MTIPAPRPSPWSGGLILAALAAICTALVAMTHSMTAPRIAANEQAYLEQSLQPVLEGIDYEGELSMSAVSLSAPDALPGSGSATVYRVFADARPIAALFIVTTRDGYSGPIRLLIGVAAGGAITGVRVLGHRETPGLGDRIEATKSDWILGFKGRSLTDPPTPEWAIVADDGAFDQLTGASITSRAVIKAIRDTLLYFHDNRELVFTMENSDE